MVSAARARSERERSHTMVVGAGLYILRYVSAKAAAPRCPFVTVKIPPRNGRGISLISVPHSAHDSLAAPGDCIVVRAENAGALNLTISAADPDTSLDAEFRLERIVTVNEAIDQKRAGAQATRSEIEIVAHVSRRGDVFAGPGEWICGPDLPMPIEGIQIDWPNKPADVELEYTVAVSRSNQKRVLGGVAGDFAGSRGKSTPIVGLDLALKGPGASRYQLRADALVFGGAVTSKRGNELSFAGPTGREPLVGLRLAAVPADDQSRNARYTAAAASPAQSQLGKVRVYRPAAASSPRTS
jgi:hypothetical protein